MSQEPEVGCKELWGWQGRMSRCVRIWDANKTATEQNRCLEISETRFSFFSEI